MNYNSDYVPDVTKALIADEHKFSVTQKIYWKAFTEKWSLFITARKRRLYPEEDVLEGQIFAHYYVFKNKFSYIKTRLA